MSSNRGVVYLGQGKVEVQSIDYPKMVRSTRPFDRPWRDPEIRTAWTAG